MNLLDPRQNWTHMASIACERHDGISPLKTTQRCVGEYSDQEPGSWWSPEGRTGMLFARETAKEIGLNN